MRNAAVKKVVTVATVPPPLKARYKNVYPLAGEQCSRNLQRLYTRRVSTYRWEGGGSGGWVRTLPVLLLEACSGSVLLSEYSAFCHPYR